MSVLDGLRSNLHDAATQGWLPEPFAYGFAVNALLCAVLIGPLLGGMGTLVVTKRLALFAQAVGQAAITGVAVGLLVGEPAERPFVSLFAVCVLFALLMNYTRHRAKMPADTLIAVFLSISLAAGVCLLPALGDGADAHLVESVLFGSILTVGDIDILVLLCIGGVCAATLAKYFNQLMLASFNSELAQVRDRRAILLDYVFVLLVTLVTVAAVKIVGAILVEALLVVPAATARNLSSSLRSFVGWSVALCTVSCIAGILVPMLFDWPLPSGAAIVLAAAAAFVLSLPFRAWRAET